MQMIHLRTIIFVVGILFGIWAGYGSQYASDIALVLGALFVIQSGLWMLGSYLQKNVLVPSVMALFSLGVILGIVRVQMEPEPQALICERACTIEAYVARSPEQKDSYQELVLEVDDEHARVLVRAPLYPEYQIGDRLSVTGVIRTPQAIMPHGDKQFFDYGAYLQTRSIGSESLYPKITVIDEEAHTFTHLLGRLKEDMVARIDSAIDLPASSLASGMLFGNASMSKELTETFRVAGLSHIVVLSGFNIAIIISFVLLLLRVVPLFVRVLIASLSVVMFVVMVGGEASVIRATLMAGVSLLALVLGREYVARQALFVSLLCIMMYEPYALLHDVSLHLSFIATMGIVYMSGVLQTVLSRYVSSRYLVEICATTLAAYIATLPYLMHTFGVASLYALFANILVVPWVPVAMLLSFLVVVFSFISQTLTALCAYVVSMLLDLMIAVAKQVSSLPYASISVSLSYSQMIVVYVVLICVYLYVSSRASDETYRTKPDDEDTFIY
ncbi:MAG: ComEC/Rec2 family competence protein [Candidatus Pacebacteria bacterium]|nr:ComEC/Rec2 family competence protein [Candidatus Paceibacterota bacterium]